MGDKPLHPIEKARVLLRPSKVRYDHVPGWLKRTIKLELGRIDDRWQQNAWDYLFFAKDKLAGGSSMWLDHYGTTTWRGRKAFVSEPYLSPAGLKEAMKFADGLGLEFDISPNSYWYPGNTTRLIFMEARHGDLQILQEGNPLDKDGSGKADARRG